MLGTYTTLLSPNDFQKSRPLALDSISGLCEPGIPVQGKLESRLAQIEFEFQKNLARKFFEQSGTGCRTGLSMPTGKSKVCKHGKRIEECTELRNALLSP